MLLLAKKSIILSITLLLLAVIGVNIFSNLTVSAANNQTNQTSSADVKNKGYDCAKIGCSDKAATQCTKDGCDFIKKYLNPAINLFSMTFLLVAVGSLIYGGIQYSASGGDAQRVSQAKSRITNTIIAVIAYFFLFAFLQFLVPGGLFNRT